MDIKVCVCLLIGFGMGSALQDSCGRQSPDLSKQDKGDGGSTVTEETNNTLYCTPCLITEPELHVIFLQHSPFTHVKVHVEMPSNRNKNFTIYEVSLVLLSSVALQWEIVTPPSVNVTSIVMIPGVNANASVKVLGLPLKVSPPPLGLQEAIGGATSLEDVYNVTGNTVGNFTTFLAYRNISSPDVYLLLQTCQYRATDIRTGQGRDMSEAETMMLITTLVPTVGVVLVVTVVAVACVAVTRKRRNTTRQDLSKLYTQTSMDSNPYYTGPASKYRQYTEPRPPPLPTFPPPATPNDYVSPVNTSPFNSYSERQMRMPEPLPAASPYLQAAPGEQPEEEEEEGTYADMYSYITCIDPPAFTNFPVPLPDFGLPMCSIKSGASDSPGCQASGSDNMGTASDQGGRPYKISNKQTGGETGELPLRCEHPGQYPNPDTLHEDTPASMQDKPSSLSHQPSIASYGESTYVGTPGEHPSSTAQFVEGPARVTCSNGVCSLDPRHPGSYGPRSRAQADHKSSMSSAGPSDCNNGQDKCGLELEASMEDEIKQSYDTGVPTDSPHSTDVMRDGTLFTYL